MQDESSVSDNSASDTPSCGETSLAEKMRGRKNLLSVEQNFEAETHAKAAYIHPRDGIPYRDKPKGVRQQRLEENLRSVAVEETACIESERTDENSGYILKPQPPPSGRRTISPLRINSAASPPKSRLKSSQLHDFASSIGVTEFTEDYRTAKAVMFYSTERRTPPQTASQ